MVEKNERTGASLITVEVAGGGIVAVAEDQPSAEYKIGTVLRSSSPALLDGASTRVLKVVIEVQRRHGGLAPRALIGGGLTVREAGDTMFEVCVAEESEYGRGEPCPSFLWRKPFISGLPLEFAPAVLKGVEEAGQYKLPSGLLRVDRAGYDEIESSTVSFTLAAVALRCVLSALVSGKDVEGEVASLIRSW